jgi:hypothetical protein
MEKSAQNYIESVWKFRNVPKSTELVHKKWKDPLQDKNPTSLFISKEKPRLYYSNLRDSNNINMKLACSFLWEGQLK